MEHNYWFITRQKQQLTDILPTLIAFNDICVGKKWSGNKELQLKFEDELENRGIIKSSERRSRRSGKGGGGVRTLYTQLQDLGFIFAREKDKTVQLTLVGKDLIMGSVSFVEAIKMQLKRYQYPSATRLNGIGSVSSTFKLHPFLFLLKLLLIPDINGYLTKKEIAYIVIREAKDDKVGTINKISKIILKYRKKGIVYQKDKDLENSAATFCGYLEATQFIKNENRQIKIVPECLDEINKYVNDKIKFINNPEDKESYLRNYGKGNRARDARNFEKIGETGRKERLIHRVLEEYIFYSLHKPITEIDEDVLSTISQKLAISKEEVERILINNKPVVGIDNFLSRYRELAYMGKNGATDFEIATCELFRNIFKLNALHVGPKGNTPDVVVSSDDDKYCGIIDNKSYSKTYSIPGDHKRRMIDVYIPNVKDYSGINYELQFFAYISGEFKSTVEKRIMEIYKETNIPGCAVPVEIVIRFADGFVNGVYNSKHILPLFSKNKQLGLKDLNDLNCN